MPRRRLCFPRPLRPLFAVLGLALAVGGHALRGGEASVLIPAGDYRPIARATTDPELVPVVAFHLDVLPVTNAEFLAFVTAHPQWRRSRVSPLFADETYLSHWTGDLDPGPSAPADAPVVNISWFAARAYARAQTKRLPTLAEWELAAAAGYTTPVGRDEAAFKQDLYTWLSAPTPEVLPSVATARATLHGAHGLHGLVWEWVDDFDTAMVTGESRADAARDQNLFCGGAAAAATDPGDYAAFMRQALRSSLKARQGTSSLGFRCATDLPPRTPMKTAALFLSLLPLLAADACCAAALPAEAPLPAASIYQTEVAFTTDADTSFRLAELRGHPVALVMFFPTCTYACPTTVADLARIREQLPEAERARTRIVMVSFDTERDTVAVLHQFREARTLDADWVLLRGTDDSVRELAALLGVKFKREADGNFAHSNLITILSAEGEIVHQRAGLTGGLNEAAAALLGAVRSGEKSPDA